MPVSKKLPASFNIDKSAVFSKVFEHCIIHRFYKCLTSGSAQFGFKKNTGYRNAIYTARKAVEQLNQVQIYALLTYK